MAEPSDQIPIEAAFARALLIQLVVATAVVILSLIWVHMPVPTPTRAPSFWDYPFDVRAEQAELILALGLVFFGPAAAILMLKRVPAHSYKIMAVVFIVYVPVFHEIERQVVDRHAAVALAGILAIAILLIVTWRLRESASSTKKMHGEETRRLSLIDTIAVSLITLLLWPTSFRNVAIATNLNDHIVSFAFGPAIAMRYGDGLVPGTDFFSQYGVGQAFFFSWFIGADARDTVENFMRFSIPLAVAFYATAYLICVRYIGSRFWVVTAIFTGLLLNFQGPENFLAPSNWPIRYPLLFVIGALFAETISERTKWAPAALGVALGLSLFWNTETGIYFCAAVALGLFVWQWPPLVRKILIVAASGFASFLFACVGAFGAGAVSSGFLLGLIDPLLLYGGGFGSYLINWNPGYGYIYAISSEMIVAATISALVVLARAKILARDGAAAFVAIIGFVGLLMMTKYYTRSLDALWHLNSLPILVVIAWWSRRLHLSIGNFNRIANLGLPVFVVLLCALFVTMVQDGRNPSYYALNSYLRYPSIANAVWQGIEWREWPEDPRHPIADAADVALVTELTSPGSQVTMLNKWDWAYLIQARRAPKFYFVPFYYGYWFQEHNVLESSEVIFVDFEFLESAQFADLNPALAAVLIPIVKDQFRIVAHGTRLVAMRKIHS